MFKQEIEQMELVKTRLSHLTSYTTATRASQIECQAAALPRSHYANLGRARSSATQHQLAQQDVNTHKTTGLAARRADASTRGCRRARIHSYMVRHICNPAWIAL